LSEVKRVAAIAGAVVIGDRIVSGEKVEDDGNLVV
jgi:hypothetical protein